MYTRWTKGLTEQQKKDFDAQVVAAYPAMKKLVELLEEELNSTEKAVEDKENYSKDSWAYFQADLIGEKRVYKKIIRIINNLYKKS